MLLARLVSMAVTTMAMKNSMGKMGRRRSFHCVLLRSSGARQSRHSRTGGNNSARSFRLEIARLGRPSWRSLYVVDVAKNVHGGDLVLSLQSRN